MLQRSQITQLLDAAARGEGHAADELLPLVYGELRALAAAQLSRMPPGQTIQPTALVHEAYLKIRGGDSRFENRRHFFFVAARAIRDILVDRARQKAALKRGGDRRRVHVDQLDLAIAAPADDMLALHEAMELLKDRYPRKHEVVMLRFFAGLTENEAAEIMGVSVRTLKRDWKFARAQLHSVLTSSEDGQA